MWFYFNWQSDWIQKDPGRINPSFYICFTPLLFSFIIAFTQGGLLGIMGVSVYLLTILLYSLKAKNKNFGIFGPAFRIITILGHFTMLSACLHHLPSGNTLIVVLVISFFKGIRNLIGDIRDIRTDKWELPARLGITISKTAIRIMFIITISLSFFINDKILVITSLFFLVFSWCSLEVLFSLFKKKDTYLIGYLGHRLLILTISIYLSILLFCVGFSILAISILIILLFLLQPFYTIIPGKKYPFLKDIFIK